MYCVCVYIYKKASMQISPSWTLNKQKGSYSPKATVNGTFRGKAEKLNWNFIQLLQLPN